MTNALCEQNPVLTGGQDCLEVKKMNRKISCILVMTLLIAININVISMENIIPMKVSLPDDELDQEQTNNCNYGWWIHNAQWLAQEFIPTKEILTRVFLQLFYKGFKEQVLTCSIRSHLEGNDLMSITINPHINREGYTNWIEFDFEDIVVIPGEKYYIILGSEEGESNYCYCWSYDVHDPYLNGSSWISKDDGNTWKIAESTSHKDTDCAFFTYGYNDPNAFADLDCQEDIIWNDVKPGEILTKNFSIFNSGTSNSFLSWEIIEYPDQWGIWEFSKKNGHDLSPEDGAEIIEITVTAPDEKNGEFTGEIKVININNPDDYEIIPITLSTPRNNAIDSIPFIDRLLEKHPHIYHILRQLLSNRSITQ